MTNFAILIETDKKQFKASLAGALQVRVIRPSRDQAIDALKTEIEQRIALDELLTLDIDSDSASITHLAGKYSDDPTLNDICNDAYQARDAEKTA